MKVCFGAVAMFLLASMIPACPQLMADDFANKDWMVDMRREEQVQEEAGQTPIFGTKGDDCEEKWGAALLWITRNSHRKIKTQSDMLIATKDHWTRLILRTR